MTTQAHILVPIDGGEAAKRAVGYGAALANRLGARLSFSHVQAASGSIVELKPRFRLHRGDEQTS